MPTDTLPTGTVTFLFSDIEGSTKLLNALGEDYPPLLETHQRLMRDAFERHGGLEIATEGDSFFVAFRSAPDAVAAAVAAQRALAVHDWGDAGPVRARIGLHTGEGLLGGDNYVGIDVHRAARIMSAGHGGQIVVSEPTRALVRQTLPEGATIRDLGEHRLKDLPEPEHLFQVDVEGLPAEFPPLRTLERRVANLPEQLTTFVGRRRELDDVISILSKTRLLTLTGPGGTGKTRLSIEVARETVDDFDDGAAFVALSPLRDPALVVPTIAQALGLREDPSRPPVDAVAENLRDKRMLVVLDNFEQVMEAASDIGQLLAVTSGATFLVTSREALGLHGEREYQVPPLALPDVRRLPPLDALSQYEAVRLFIDRATAVKTGFSITNENAPAVAEITSRLDGLPLAIELAAARIKLLSPQAILSRLEERLSLLVGGARDRPARQQTLRDAIAWSYDLLDEPERRFFSRLAIFRGGFTLEAAEEVCNPDAELGLDTFDGIESLVNKSLLRQTEVPSGEPRFFMLFTIRDYAGERLAEGREQADIARRHQEFFLGLAERARPELLGPRQADWLDALEREHDNIRAVLDRASDIEFRLRLSAALWRFWQFRGHLREARTRLEELVARPEAREQPRALAEALEGAGGVAYWMGDWAACALHYGEMLTLYRELGDKRGEAEALYNLSFPYHVPVTGGQEDLDRARDLLEGSLRLFGELGDQAGLAKVTWGLSNLYYRLGDLDRAERAAEESLEAYRRLDDRFGAGWALHSLGVSKMRRGDLDGAESRFREALRIFADARDSSGLTLVLADCAVLAWERGQRPRGARLAGAAFALQEASGTDLALFVADEEQFQEDLRQARESADTADDLAAGRRMSVDEAVNLALEAS
ncbi:MAG TPA: adenylate/guanylate cyclase domain-containing protein [Actinomycetota bacterium]|nr:adenylate/guanylate cyclase domain-containing protein [Actinomycetota bacterium]